MLQGEPFVDLLLIPLGTLTDVVIGDIHYVGAHSSVGSFYQGIFY